MKETKIVMTKDFTKSCKPVKQLENRHDRREAKRELKSIQLNVK